VLGHTWPLTALCWQREPSVVSKKRVLADGVEELKWSQRKRGKTVPTPPEPAPARNKGKSPRDQRAQARASKPATKPKGKLDAQ
jgi:hypothetical protein